MRSLTLAIVGLIALVALWTWRSQLFTVGRPGESPRPLALEAPDERAAVALDVVLPAVPIGMKHLQPGTRVLLLHYWAPWEQNARLQAAGLDSLRRIEALDGLEVVVVCFDPFPSVARFVARQGLRLNVLLDTERRLRRSLPCPSLPYTYVLDRRGRIAVSQSGEVDWLAPGTRRTLGHLLAEARPSEAPGGTLSSAPGTRADGTQSAPAPLDSRHTARTPRRASGLSATRTTPHTSL